MPTITQKLITKLKTDLPKDLLEQVNFDHKLANLNTWKVGGSAKIFFTPKDFDAMSSFFKALSNITCDLTAIKIIPLGLGSNILVRDNGIDGIVIYTKHLNNIANMDNKIIAQAGVSCAKVAKVCTKLGMEKAAFFAGIPGTIGGAIAMNAGAFGGQTFEHLTSVMTMDYLGNTTWRDKLEFQVGYREVTPQNPNEIFLAGNFVFPIGSDIAASQDKIKALLKQRNLSQPIGTFNCGSVFKNPPDNFAAKLIEQAKLKGYKLGGARVSSKHANFIINEDKASASEIETLIEYVQNAVFAESGIKLEPEVKIIGEK